jgi:quercetin dioxygenase-like cupin family protein
MPRPVGPPEQRWLIWPFSAAVEFAARHIFPRHTHEQFGIGVIRRGASRSRSGRGMVEAGSGDIITVNPGEVHKGAPIDVKA